MSMQDNETGQLWCPFCRKFYTPTFPTYDAAMASEDMDAREQWISGCCSGACWDRALGPPDDPQD